MDTNSAIEVLNLFNEKANKLESLSFAHKLFTEKSGFNFSAQAGVTPEVAIKRYGPDDESIEAFVLTLRLFVQDKDRISIRKISELYDKLPIDSTLKQQVVDARNSLNQSLDDRTMLVLDKEPITYGRIFYVFLYGGLAHSDPDKKVVFDKWSNDKLVFPILQNDFVAVLGNFLSVIFFIRKINYDAIKQLQDILDTP